MKNLPSAPAQPVKNETASALSAKASNILRKFPGKNFLEDDKISDDAVIDAEQDKARYQSLTKSIRTKSILATVLSALIIFGGPVMKPSYHYLAMLPRESDKPLTPNEVMPLVPLSMPNMTHEAVLSWATTTITEIMTVGFGDFDKQIMAQRTRFTSLGWKSFLIAMRDGGMRDQFKKQQLILTSVPADTPVVVAEGPDEENTYQWQIEMPIIMTFATNNEVTKRQRSIIKLTIVRIPGKENIRGIAIKAWNLS